MEVVVEDAVDDVVEVEDVDVASADADGRRRRRGVVEDVVDRKNGVVDRKMALLLIRSLATVTISTPELLHSAGEPQISRGRRARHRS